jgi:protein transport protein SEC24
VNTGSKEGSQPVAAAKVSPRFDKYSTSPRASSSKNNSGSQGTAQNKKAPRIDPAQMPRPPPVETKVTYYTRSGSGLRYPPPSTHCYTGIDLGNCNPRFMRCTTVSPATTHAIQISCGLPLGLVMTPFAKLENEEEPMPVVNFENLPPRCHRCKAYVNLDVKWSNDGNKWNCNLCKAQNEVPSWYFSSLDGAGLRIDRGNRTELQFGSFDIVAPADYCVRPLQESIYLFAIDISPLAIEMGLAEAAIDAVETVLGSLPAHDSCKVGIFTFDSQIQFYTVRGNNNNN